MRKHARVRRWREETRKLTRGFRHAYSREPFSRVAPCILIFRKDQHRDKPRTHPPIISALIISPSRQCLSMLPWSVLTTGDSLRWQVAYLHYEPNCTFTQRDTAKQCKTRVQIWARTSNGTFRCFSVLLPPKMASWARLMNDRAFVVCHDTRRVRGRPELSADSKSHWYLDLVVVMALSCSSTGPIRSRGLLRNLGASSRD